ncbi:MAG: fused MFS/spermidine synthase [Planctomycetes bacterium]|nr:fused MFS/spermidine synthase [Planctomycetota bacterium]
MLRPLAFLLFVASGFCGLLYQVVWLRLALASFGIVTPVLSVVLSVFMLGLALGSWLGGRVGNALTRRSAGAAAVGYGVAEFGIGAGALIVPWAFDLGEVWLQGLGESSSTGYLAASAVVITASILLFTTLMGATFPLMMAFLRAATKGDEETFSYLYLGNVVGAMAGALTTAMVLIELLGFRQTLLVAAVVNVAIGVVAMLMPRLSAGSGELVEAPRTLAPEPVAADERRADRRLRLALLFATGFTSMAMEVVWTRAFTPVLKTTIYAFAAVLTTYLFATWVGSALYRVHLRRGRAASATTLLPMLFLASLLPLVCNDPRWHESSVVVLLSLVPISLLLGYLTPQLVDEHARGEPGAAGRAYAINVIGCILGPLFSGYVLLPLVGVKWALLSMALVYPLFLFRRAPRRVGLEVATKLAAVAVLLLAVFSTRTHEDPSVYEHAEVRRDATASVVAHGEGMERRLLVNGVGITTLTPVTKVMAHLPLVMRERPPESTCVICFGMGTTFRSLLSWGGRATAVELVPSVTESFGFFWDDAAQKLAMPEARIVVDDGRRFLARTEEQFDLITIDPPPPVEAGGSSLLYSAEFYDVLKARLTPTGVLAQWFPGGEERIARAVINTLNDSFPHLQVCRSFEPPHVGLHLLASLQPLERPTVEQAIARMPEAAKQDLLEWSNGWSLELAWSLVLAQFRPVEDYIPEDRDVKITDDRPYNEYFWLRRTFGGDQK